jgi:hypothetical protein
MNPRVFLDVDPRTLRLPTSRRSGADPYKLQRQIAQFGTRTMTTTTGEELLKAIQDLRNLFPDWRMGQLVANLTQAAGRDREGAIWEVEDDQLLAAARRLIERNRGREAPRPEAFAAADAGA